MLPREAAIAANRFGLGARTGELDAAAGDPRSWLLSQLAGPAPMPAGTLTTTRAMVAELVQRRRMGKPQDAAGQAAVKQLIESGREHMRQEIAARLRLAASTPASFRERLVWFWSNHFTVSGRKPRVLGVAGAFEREAIRPHVTGRFGTMLQAVVRHPAMLTYLDNLQSIGPSSPAGLRREKGLNENLARELLELHTLGVGGGYGQGDVEQLARMLTGWSIAVDGDGDAHGFAFHDRLHEPGPKALLGRRFAEAGPGEVEAALAMLAQHPATARHVATKLARHFVADAPPAASVARLERAFLDSGGDLPAVYRALLADGEAWGARQEKLKSPVELVASVLRAADAAAVPDEALVGSLRQLGQLPFTAPSPAGFADEAAAWAGPELVMERLDWCAAVGRRLRHLDPVRLAEQSLGPMARPETRAAVAQAPSAAIGVGLVFAAPEFQRR